MKTIKTTIATIIILLSFLIPISLTAQAPPPPPPDHGSTGNQNGGNAPVGGGMFILLGLGAAYGGKKIYEWKKEGLEE